MSIRTAAGSTHATAVPAQVISPYPQDREAQVALRDGSTAHIRPVRNEDREAIRSFLEGLSPDSIGFRFFGTPNLDWVTGWSVDVDYANRFALVAETGTPSRIIAHAAYIRDGDDRAEVAFMVADHWQGRGIATIMLAHLAEVAAGYGISTFTAQVLSYNHRMIEVFRQSGFPVEMRSTAEAIEIELPTSLSDDALARFEDRERTAAIAAVKTFLEPSNVAVIGASRRRGTVGGEILHNLISAPFNGAVYAVNPRAEVVQSLPAYRSIGEVPAAVDLAVVVVPAPDVVEVANECAAAGVRGLLVISAGFAEAGEEGLHRQRALLAVCRSAGMRLVGPNCLGVLNTSPAVQLNATFAPHAAQPGTVGFMSQSGGLGIAIIEAASRVGMGLSSFVSVGNKADLSGNDFLCYWEQDPGTDLALLYLESCGNPRKFARIAPRFARQKPLLAVKSGRSSAGTRATSSHTGALLSASDVTVDALFEQAGVIRTDTLTDLAAVGSLLSNQPVPQGGRVAIVTNAGGPGIMCADACQAHGVEVPELPAAVKTKLLAFLPSGASAANPIDMIATASAEHYGRALTTLIEEDACDAILAIFVPPLVTAASDVATAIRQVAETKPAVPIAAVFMTAEGLPAELNSSHVRVPGYEFPEVAAQAIALAAKYGHWRARPPEEPAVLQDVRAERAAAIISNELAAGTQWLSPIAVTELLQCYGLPLSRTESAGTVEQSIDLAAEVGYPVVLKAIAPGLIHKSDVGAVKLDLRSASAVLRAARQIEAAVRGTGRQLEGLVVQPMAPQGVELIAGVVHDPSFGPVLACGTGGTTAELIKDVAVRITPVHPSSAAEMVRSLRTFPLLDGYRGSVPCDVGAVEDVLVRVSAMVEAHPEIVELDCNPVIAGPDGAVIVDARIRIGPASPLPPVPSLDA